MAHQLAARSFSDSYVHQLSVDVRAGAQSRSPLLITGERDTTRRVARLAQRVSETFDSASRFAVVNPDVLSESLAQFLWPRSATDITGASAERLKHDGHYASKTLTSSHPPVRRCSCPFWTSSLRPRAHRTRYG